MTVKTKTIELAVRYEHRGAYLFAHVTGPDEDLESAQTTWRAIAAACKQGNYSKVLILEEIEKQMPFMQQYAFAESVGQLGFDTITMAFVDGKPEQFANNKFAEDVAVNRGAHGRIFQTIAEAEAWLLAR